MGIPEGHMPRTWEGFKQWMDGLIDSEEITVTSEAREIARTLLQLPVPIFWPVNYALAAGTLPEKLREGFGLRWNSNLQSVLDFEAGVVRAVATRLPLWLRATPMYWQAVRRCRGQQAVDSS